MNLEQEVLQIQNTERIQSPEEFISVATNIILSSTELNDEEKAELLAQVDVEPEKGIQMKIIFPLMEGEHRSYLNLFNSINANTFTPENICNILFLKNKNLHFEDIMKTEIYSHSFENTVQKLKYYKSHDINALNALKSYPQYLDMSLQDVELERLKNIEIDPISDEAKELIGKILLEISKENAEVGRTEGRILSHDENIILFKALESIDFSLIEWKELEKIEKTIEKIFVCKNKGLVLFCLRKLKFSDFTSKDVDDDGLIQAGNIGLLIAIRAFQYRIGSEFSTYAIYWIRQTMQREYAASSQQIRRPVYMNQALKEYNKAISNFKKEGNHKPSEEDLIKRLNITQETLSTIKSAIKTSTVSSLDKQITTEDELTLYDLISDSNMLSTDVIAIMKVELGEAGEIMEKVLKYREKTALIEKFVYEKTYEQIGKRLGVTKERAKQIIEESLMKINRYLKENNIRL